MFTIDFLHNNLPSSELFDLGFIKIYWYGFLMTVAVIIGFLLCRRLLKPYNIKNDHLIDLGFYLVIFGLLGARLAHVIVELPYYIEHPGEILLFWHGGMAIHGAVIAGASVLAFYAKSRSSSIFPQISDWREGFLRLADIISMPLILGQAIGRWGNYFNQELYGLPTGLPWGIPISMPNRVEGFESFSYFHPAFLYESAANLALFLLLFLIWQKRDKMKSKLAKTPGFIFSLYLAGYSLIRIGVETIRIDRMPEVFGIRLAILASALLLIVASWLMWYIYIYKKKNI